MLNLKTANFIDKKKYLTNLAVEIKVNNIVVNDYPINEIRKIAEENNQTLNDVSLHMDELILSDVKIAMLKKEINNTITILEKELVAA